MAPPMATTELLELLVEPVPSTHDVWFDDLGDQSRRLGFWVQQLLQPLRYTQHGDC